MKKGIKRLFGLIILPVMLLVGGCNLFNNNDDDDDTVYETQEQMFDKYMSAASKSFESKIYTIVESRYYKEDDVEVSEYLTTKDEVSYHYVEVDDAYEEHVVKHVGQGKPENTFVKYNRESATSFKAKYQVINDFDGEFSIKNTALGGLLNKFFDSRTKTKLIFEFEELMKLDESAILNESDTIFNFSKENGEYILNISKSYTLFFDEMRSKADMKLKITFTEKLEKITFSVDQVELNDDNTEKENGMKGTSIEESNIEYSFDTKIARTDFSDYPTPKDN